MSIDNKLDQLLSDTAALKAVSAQHTDELKELKTKLEPVFFHVTGIKWAVKLGGIAIGILTCAAGVLALLK